MNQPRPFPCLVEGAIAKLGGQRPRRGLDQLGIPRKCVVDACPCGSQSARLEGRRLWITRFDFWVSPLGGPSRRTTEGRPRRTRVRLGSAADCEAILGARHDCWPAASRAKVAKRRGELGLWRRHNFRSAETQTMGHELWNNHDLSAPTREGRPHHHGASAGAGRGHFFTEYLPSVRPGCQATSLSLSKIQLRRDRRHGVSRERPTPSSAGVFSELIGPRGRPSKSLVCAASSRLVSGPRTVHRIDPVYPEHTTGPFLQPEKHCVDGHCLVEALRRDNRAGVGLRG